MSTPSIASAARAAVGSFTSAFVNMPAHGRVLSTLLFEIKPRSTKRGLATVCIGGCMGIAMSCQNKGVP
jgi:hypothetical protein